MTEKYKSVRPPELEPAGTRNVVGDILTTKDRSRRRGQVLISLLELTTEADFRRYVSDYESRWDAAEGDPTLQEEIKAEYYAVYDGIPIDIWWSIYSPKSMGGKGESH